MASLAANHVQVHPFRRSEGGVEHLVLRRAPGDSLCPRMWQVVTGTIESGERSATAAARELSEETGLSALLWRSLPTVAIFYFEPTDQIVLAPIFACEIGVEAVPILSEEHDAFLWLTASQAIDLLPTPSHREGVTAIETYLAHGV